MDKETIKKEFEKNYQTIQQLLARQEQLKGQFMLLEEQEKESKKK